MARKAKVNEVENVVVAEVENVVVNEVAGVAFENAVAEVESVNASEYGVKIDPMAAAEDASAAEENAVDVAPVELSAPVAVAPVVEVENVESARRKYQRKEESEKAKRDRLTVEKMPEKIFKYNHIPENIGELSAEEKRVVLSGVIEKNDELLEIYNGIAGFMSLAHGANTYERKAEYIKIVIPNRNAIKGENRKARNMLLDTYNTLPAAVMEAMENAIKNASGYKKDKLGDLLQDCRKNLYDYIVLDLFESGQYLLDIVFAGVPSIVLEDATDDNKKILMLAGYKENGRYTREAITVAGVGVVNAVNGVIYEKQ